MQSCRFFSSRNWMEGPNWDSMSFSRDSLKTNVFLGTWLRQSDILRDESDIYPWLNKGKNKESLRRFKKFYRLTYKPFPVPSHPIFQLPTPSSLSILELHWIQKGRISSNPLLAMAGVSLKCGDCGTLLKSVEEAQEHAELTKHTNFTESTEPVLNLICSTCGKPCRSKTVTCPLFTLLLLKKNYGIYSSLFFNSWSECLGAIFYCCLARF